MNLIDKAISAVNPEAGLRRAYARDALRFMQSSENKYRQLKATPRHKNLEVEIGSEEQEFEEADRNKTTATMRYFHAENSMVQGIIETIKDNTCGPEGPALQVQTDDDNLNDQIENEWKNFGSDVECDLRNEMNMGEIIRMCCQDQVLVGDIGVSFNESGKFALIETDRISTPDKNKDDTIIHGVKIEQPIGRALGYYVGNRGKAIGQIEKHAFFEANNFFLHKRKIRVDSLRGRSELFPNIENLYDLDEYLQAEKMAAKFAAIFVVKKISKNPNPDNANSMFGKLGTGSNANGENKSNFEDKFSRVKVGTALASELREGEDIQIVDNKRPGAQFTPYVEMISRLIGVGVRLPIELVLLDYKNANFSSIRAAFNEARRCFEARQASIKKLCNWMFKHWFYWKIANGEISIPDKYVRLPLEWQFPGWDYINPKEEIEASKLAIDSEISNAAIECARIGRDQRTVAKGRQKELAFRKQNKLPTTVGSPGQTILYVSSEINPSAINNFSIVKDGVK